MPASSADSRAPENIRPGDVYRLLEIVHTAGMRHRSFVASRFAESAIHFEETLSMLQEVGWLREQDGQIWPVSELVARIATTSGTERALVFGRAWLSALGARARPLARYLANFQVADGVLVQHSVGEARLKYAGPRDFLMDLGAVSHNIASDSYLLLKPFAEWAVWGRNAILPTSDQLKASFNNREELGVAAELAVLAWEKRRVGEGHQGQVLHVAAENPAACFDIQSVTLAGNTTTPRFIEVKAVAPELLEFHWSQGEIEAAEILQARYFLYLVPVAGHRVFDLDHIVILQDAYKVVYQDSRAWSKSFTNVLCRRIRSPAS